MEQRKITIAIPHFNNSHFVNDLLKNVINDDRVDEIILCDDKSKDIENLKKLINHKKIKLFINKTNLGCYHNKLNTLSKCKNEWACLIDSDNIIDKSFIDKLFSFKIWDKNLIYAPMWAYTFGNGYGPSPNLNYSKYKNMLIDKKKYINLYNSKNISFRCLTNTCNYFLPVNKYLAIMNQYTYDRNLIDAVDSNILFSDWINNNNKVLIVEGLIYKHRLHKDSNYTRSKSKKYSEKVQKLIISKLNKK